MEDLFQNINWGFSYRIGFDFDNKIVDAEADSKIQKIDRTQLTLIATFNWMYKNPQYMWNKPTDDAAAG